MTITVDLPPPARALAIGAHPDDVEFGCGATLAKWARAGTEVHLLVCTDGSKGSWDPAQDTTELVARRQDEQRAAAAALGATGEVAFLGYVDGELGSGLAERSAVARVIRHTRPDVVLGHDPWKRYRLHPDHRHAGRIVVEGLVAARDPHFFPEHGMAAHRPGALLLFEADEPDHLETVAEPDLERKLAALEQHRSQLLSTMHVDLTAPDAERQLAAFRARVRARLVEHAALAGVALGEQFKALRDL